MSAHRFRFRRGELEFELEGEREFVEAQMASWLPKLLREAPAAKPEAPPQAPAEAEPADGFRRVPADFAPRVNVSLGEFVAMKQAEAAVDLVAVAGYYMEKYRRQERFSPEELAHELSALPAWAGREVAGPSEAAVAQGYMERLRDGSYTMTYKGQNYVRNGLVP